MKISPEVLERIKNLIKMNADQFRAYEEAHLKKGTAEGREKANTNASMAHFNEFMLDRLTTLQAATDAGEDKLKGLAHGLGVQINSCKCQGLSGFSTSELMAEYMRRDGC